MIDSCRAFIAKKIGQDEAVKQLRKILVWFDYRINFKKHKFSS
jgi:hypothetical protein